MEGEDRDWVMEQGRKTQGPRNSDAVDMSLVGSSVREERKEPEKIAINPTPCPLHSPLACKKTAWGESK